ncbi:MAG: M67 family metallopeptidase [Acidobacteriota bacterium]|nr:M67 family metallopeptidase [Acidobacteriota bacterium]
MPDPVHIRREILERLLDEARRNPEIECCGLLAGTGGVITEILPAHNALVSATAYEIAPEELFRLFRHLRDSDLDHLGIYHSHPATDNAPSPTDIARAYYPDAAYFIISLRTEAPRPVRAFEIRDGVVMEVEIVQE